MVIVVGSPGSSFADVVQASPSISIVHSGVSSSSYARTLASAGSGIVQYSMNERSTTFWAIRSCGESGRSVTSPRTSSFSDHRPAPFSFTARASKVYFRSRRRTMLCCRLLGARSTEPSSLVDCGSVVHRSSYLVTGLPPSWTASSTSSERSFLPALCTPTTFGGPSGRPGTESFVVAVNISLKPPVPSVFTARTRNLCSVPGSSPPAMYWGT